MASQRRHSRSTEKYPLGSPAEWIAEGHVTCNIQCSAKCDRRMVDVRLDTLPQDLPWSTIGRPPRLQGMRHCWVREHCAELA
jgi:hypothetical protein